MSRNIRSALPVPCHCTLYTLNPSHVFEFIRIATASEKNVDHILLFEQVYRLGLQRSTRAKMVGCLNCHH